MTEDNPLGQYILDDAGEAQPAGDLLTWGRWMETHTAERTLAVDELGEWAPTPEEPMPTAIRSGGDAVQMLASGYDFATRMVHGQRDRARVVVSTIFTGIDMRLLRHHEGGDPVLWETRVFNGPLDGEQRRYTSRAAAAVGHEELCELVRLRLAGATIAESSER